MSSGGEKTEKPTARKRKESRKEGQVPRTQELGGWGSLLLVGMVAPSLLTRELGHLRELLVESLTAADGATAERALTLLGQAAMHAFLTVIVLGAGIAVLGVSAALAQGGFYVATKAVKPNWSRLNPIKGAKRVFGPEALWNGAKMLLKSALVGLVAWMTVRSLLPLLGGLVPIPVVIDLVAHKALNLVRNMATVGLVMAGVDYVVVRRRVGKQTRMTKEEVKQEHKQTEGDPMLKGAIRSRQLAVARSRMMADVRTADVVLVNPTHVAVALKYDAARGAPRVVALGAGAIAARIRALAAEEQVPMVRDVPLARALYRSTKVGQEIPAELFAAVAQVLAFVLSRRGHGLVGGEHRTPRGDVGLPDVPPAGRRRPIRSGPAAPGRSGA